MSQTSHVATESFLTYRVVSFSFGVLVKVCIRAVLGFLWSALPAEGSPCVFFLGFAAARLLLSLCKRSNDPTLNGDTPKITKLCFFKNCHVLCGAVGGTRRHNE